MAFDITKTVTVIKLRAKNDRNGNPRRVFLAIDSDGFTHGYDEGYNGKAAIPESIRDLYNGVVIDVAPGEYSFHVKAE